MPEPDEALRESGSAAEMMRTVLQPGLSAIPGLQLTHFIRSGGYFREKSESDSLSSVASCYVALLC